MTSPTITARVLAGAERNQIPAAAIFAGIATFADANHCTADEAFLTVFSISAAPFSFLADLSPSQPSQLQPERSLPMTTETVLRFRVRGLHRARRDACRMADSERPMTRLIASP